MAHADAMLITAGAGMGVDSGLPDFRGDHGFWSAYPSLARQGLNFNKIAIPNWFTDDPELAWGFYGHRINLYRHTSPHLGFKLLLEASTRIQAGFYVVTSNVDGQFQKAGFSSSHILELHGSIHVLQCSGPCSQSLWSANSLEIDVNPDNCRARSGLPVCPECGKIARPNILMFSDNAWISRESVRQQQAFDAWMESLQGKRLVVIEIGAGTAIPTTRWISNNAADRAGATLIRINPREYEVTEGQVSIPTGALEGITSLLQVGPACA